MTEVLLYNGKLNPYLCNEYEIIQRRLVIQWPLRVTAVQPFMHGVTAVYRTAEHAFQAMRASDLNSARQMESPRGRFDDAGAVLAKWPLGEEDKTEDVRNRMVPDNFLMGTIAKMAGKVSTKRAMQEWDLCLDRDLTVDQMTALWTYILKHKFLLGSKQAHALMSTGSALLINYHEEATATSIKYATYDPIQKQVVGGNMMGKCLMTIRKDLVYEMARIAFWDTPAWIMSEEQEAYADEKAMAATDVLLENLLALSH
jgi:predicted NAD-dependent protein-ADP-ribosyltransferase YbiA (DUF1768 family)